VQLGYLNDDFVQHFVRRPQRRAPVINRGACSSPPLSPSSSLLTQSMSIALRERQSVYERRQRRAHILVLGLSTFRRAKDEFDQRERSELPPVTDVSVLYVRVVVLGVLRRAVLSFGPEKTALP